LERSAIILAGGFSTRLGEDKGLIPLIDKPLIKYVLEAADGIVEEKIVVVHSKVQAEKFSKVLDVAAKIVVDKLDLQTPLAGAISGLTETKAEYALLLPCDTPFLSKDILAFLLDICVGRNAVVPRWPNGNIEPLHAVYNVKPALAAAYKALEDKQLTMRAMIDRLRGVRYVSTLVLQQLDPKLDIFFNINTPLDLKRAENLMRQRRCENNEFCEKF